MPKIVDTNKAKRPTEAEVAAAVAKVNEAAGYDVALAYAALNALVVDVTRQMAMPLFEGKVDLSTAADVVVRAHGGTVTMDVLSELINMGVAYGWYRGTEGVSMLRDKVERASLMEFAAQVKGRGGLTAEQRTEGITKGLAALDTALERTEKRLTVKKAVES